MNRWEQTWGGKVGRKSKALQSQGQQRRSNQPTPHRRGNTVGGQTKPVYLRGLVCPGALAAKTAKRTAASQHPATRRGAEVEVWDTGEPSMGRLERSASYGIVMVDAIMSVHLFLLVNQLPRPHHISARDITWYRNDKWYETNWR